MSQDMTKNPGFSPDSMIKPTSPEIVGVCLLRNEENFVAWSVMNVVEFCDRILVLDNGSIDRTREILESIARHHPHIEIIDVDDARDTHQYVMPFVGTSTWGVYIDGDEIYDPAGLSRLRRGIIDGEFATYWAVCPQAVHVLGIEFDNAQAFGYSAPDVMVGAKCFNLSSMVSWNPGKHQRFHGSRSIKFKPGYSLNDVYDSANQGGWDDASFRHLHLCFMPRSSQDMHRYLDNEPTGRTAMEDVWKSRSWRHRVRHLLLRRVSPKYDLTRNQKNSYYARGPINSFDITGFGSPAHHHTVDSRSESAMGILDAMTERYASLYR